MQLFILLKIDVPQIIHFYSISTDNKRANNIFSTVKEGYLKITLVENVIGYITSSRRAFLVKNHLLIIVLLFFFNLPSSVL